MAKIIIRHQGCERSVTLALVQKMERLPNELKVTDYYNSMISKHCLDREIDTWTTIL